MLRKECSKCWPAYDSRYLTSPSPRTISHRKLTYVSPCEWVGRHDSNCYISCRPFRLGIVLTGQDESSHHNDHPTSTFPQYLSLLENENQPNLIPKPTKNKNFLTLFPFPLLTFHPKKKKNPLRFQSYPFKYKPGPRAQELLCVTDFSPSIRFHRIF